MTDRRANARIRFLVLGFVAVFAVALGRAAWIQVVDGPGYAAMASRQHRETIEIPAGRGTIYDRTGTPLAIGEQATTVYADPRHVVAPAKAAVKAGTALGLDPDELYPTLRDREKRFVFVQRKADPVKAKALQEQSVAGLGFYAEERRSYPQGAVAAHLLGFAGTDNRGLDGLERSLERTLRGRPGYEIVVRDPSGHAIDVVTSRKERPGRNVVLTLDHQLQSSRRADPRLGGCALAREGSDRDRDGPEDRCDPRDGECADVRREQLHDCARRGPAQPRGDGPLRAGVDLQDRYRRRRARGQRRRTRQLVRPRADDQGLRPDDPRGPHARHRADDRAPDPGSVVERRHDHDRPAARRARARLVDRPLRLRLDDGIRAPRREPGHGASVRPLVGLDDRNGADRTGHRGDAAADGQRLRGDRQRRRHAAGARDRKGRGQEGASRGRAPDRLTAHGRPHDRDVPQRRGRGNGHRGRDPRLHRRGQDGHGEQGGERRATSRSTSPRSSASCRPEAAARDPRDGRRAAGPDLGRLVAAPLFRDIARFALQYLEVPPDAPESKRATALLAARAPTPVRARAARARFHAQARCESRPYNRARMRTRRAHRRARAGGGDRAAARRDPRPGVRHALRRQGHALRLHPGRRRATATARAEAVAAGAVGARRRAAGRRRRAAARRRGVPRGGGGGRGRVLRRADRAAHVAGVTGTNGKTTTTFMLRAILEADGRQTGWSAPSTGSSAGCATRAAHDAGGDRPAAALPRDARRRRRGRRVEASSHGSHYRRLDRVRFDALVFTNLTQEHLDLHGDMEEYFQAKRRLFTGIAPPPAAVNVGDPYGRRLADELAGAHRAPLVTFGLRPEAEVRADELELDARGARFTAAGIPLETPLLGIFNVENVLGAVAAALLLDVDEDAIAEGVRAVTGVPGRFESIDEGQEFAVVVDYAHKPDALEAVLEAARDARRGPRDRRLRRGRRPRPDEAARDGRAANGSPTASSSRTTTRARRIRCRSCRRSCWAPAPTSRSTSTGGSAIARAIAAARAGRRRRDRRQGARAGPGRSAASCTRSTTARSRARRSGDWTEAVARDSARVN